MQNNQLSSLPVAFGDQLPNLTALLLANNAELSVFPESMKKLTNLRFLDVRKTKVVSRAMAESFFNMSLMRKDFTICTGAVGPSNPCHVAMPSVAQCETGQADEYTSDGCGVTRQQAFEVQPVGKGDTVLTNSTAWC